MIKKMKAIGALLGCVALMWGVVENLSANTRPEDGDLAVYGECSAAIKPNVLFLLDTSISMRRTDVISSRIPAYDHGITYKTHPDYKLLEGGKWKYKYDTNRIYYTDTGIIKLNIMGKVYFHHIKCEEVRNGLIKNGYFKDGQMKRETGWAWEPPNMVCQDGGFKIDYTTGNYLNYLEYVDMKMEAYTFHDNEYDPTVDYYNYYASDLGYGDFRTDVVYVDMGGIRPFSMLQNGGTGVRVGQMACGDAKTKLQTKGWVKRRVWEIGNCPCSVWLAPRYMLMTGNFLNYVSMKNTRRYNAIDAIWEIVKSRANDVRFGLMQFDLGTAKIFDREFIVGKRTAWASQGGDLAFPCGAPLSTVQRILYGRFIRETPSVEYGQPLAFGYEGYWFDDWGKQTPLAESLVEAGLYFAGQKSWFNTYTIPDSFYTGTDHRVVSTEAGAYQSPIQCATQDNHIIIISDGKPHDDFVLWDDNNQYFSSDYPYKMSYKWIVNKPFPRVEGSTGDFCSSGDDCLIGDTDGDGDRVGLQDWLDDVAKYLYDHDFSKLTDKQNITTHAISLNIPGTSNSFDPGFLAETADPNGGGKYANAKDKKELIERIESFLEGSVIATSYSNAVTPVRQDDLVYSGEHTFLTFFKIKKGDRDRGNIKKFKRENNLLFGAGMAQYIASASTPAKDLWAGTETSTEEGVPVDGVAYVLWKQLDQIASATKESTMAEKFAAVSNVNGTNPGRKIYTAHDNRMGLLPDLLIGETPAVEVMRFPDLNETYDQTNLLPFLVETVYALGAKWPLGDIIHSNVVVAQYPKAGNDGSYDPNYGVDGYLIVGANDGMLHCFDVEHGREVWAFIPPDMINNLYKLRDRSNHSWLVDGGISIHYAGKDYENDQGSYTVKTPSRLIFGERRGGRSYHALDISDIHNPKYVKGIGGSGTWGQSWSKPALCQIKKGLGDQETDKTMGFVLAGGYDENQDWDNYAPAPGSDTLGKFVKVYTMSETEIKEKATIDQSIDACITSVRIIDHDHDSQRIFSRIYAGDLEGNVYHFSDDVIRTTTELPDGSSEVSWTEKEYKDMDGTWSTHHKLFEGHRYPVTDPSDDAQTVEIAQKIFYAPVMGYSCDGNMVFFGTGNRENPEDKNEVNSIYAVKEDTWEGDAYSRADLNVYTMKDEGGCGAHGANLYSLIPPDDADYLLPSEAKGWAMDFPNRQRDGEKVISDFIVLEDILIFGTYTPKAGNPNASDPADPCNPDPNCEAGHGRIYVVSTCSTALSVKSYETGTADPMPQPAIVFDSDTGKVLIATGSGKLIDPEIPVVDPDYWKHSGANL